MNNEDRSTRRQFLKGAASIGTAISVGGIVTSGMTMPNVALAETDLMNRWDKETDVVIVGYGCAGTAAALEAQSAGAEVIVVERMESGGGATKISGGIIYMGGGTPLQKALGVEDTRDDMYNYLLSAAGDGASRELIGIYCDHSLELYSWLVAHGVEFKESFISGKHVVPPADDGLMYSGNEEQEPYRSIAKPVPRGHHPKSVGFAGHAIISRLQAAAYASGIDVIYQALADQLVVDSLGRVVGVAIIVDGHKQYIKARRGVVLTAGGFSANREMVAQHCPAYLRCGVVIGTAGDDGSGIRMGQSVGVDVRLMGEGVAYSPIYSPHESLVRGILVNDNGQRYIGEDQYGDWIGNQTTRNFPNSWVVVDQSVISKIPKEVKKKLKVTVHAETVRELAKAVGIPELLLENTVREYNQMCADGEDLEFHKNIKYLQAISVPPFYALDYSAKVNWFLPKGGLKINGKAQALNPYGEPVPGLYCAGTICSGVFAQNYPASGCFIGGALTFGRIAGQNAAREISE